MKTPSSLLSSALCAVAVSTTASASHDQCYGYTPMPSLTSYLGATLSYETAEHICCNNHHYAEYAGYLEAPEVDLFGKLDPTNETVFYDSVCGIPLFIAPRGRSFEEFKKESIKHGWPSFRPEEMVSENVIIHSDGRMESKCLTHLGHNLPEGGVDRYCIDLVCVAGEPLSVDDERSQILNLVEESVLDHHELNTTEYKSSAETFSGNYNNRTRILIIVGSVVISLLLAACVGMNFVSWRKRKAAMGVAEKSQVEQGNAEDVEIM